MVARVSMPRVITFSKDKIPEGNTIHNRAIYITTCHLDICIPLILVDNGSTLNICTKDTLDMLGVSSDYVKPNPCDIRAFNNSVSRGQGEVFILLVIKGRMFQVQSQILSIPSSFTMLLGRPWIHNVGAIPSTLHQKVKFIINDEVISVPADTDVITMTGQNIQGVRNLQALNTFTPYQFEVIHIEKEGIELKRKVEILPPKFNMMTKIKFNLNKGLGKHSQGRKNPIKAIRVPYKAGLGFKPLLKLQFKKNKKKKACHKTTLHFISASKLFKTCNTLSTKLLA